MNAETTVIPMRRAPASIACRILWKRGERVLVDTWSVLAFVGEDIAALQDGRYGAVATLHGSEPLAFQIGDTFEIVER